MFRRDVQASTVTFFRVIEKLGFCERIALWHATGQAWDFIDRWSER